MTEQLAYAMAQYGAFIELLACEFERMGEETAKVVRAFTPTAPDCGEETP